MAAWFRFARPFDFQVKRGVDIAYSAGATLLIPEPHAKAAEKAGAGERVKRPERANAGIGRNDRPRPV